MKIDQLDGNISLCSTDETFSSPVSNKSPKISVQIGHRPNKILVSERLPPYRKTIRRDNKVLQAVTLPKFSSYNMRSLMPKLSSWATDMIDRMCSLSFLVEIWQKSENKKHIFKIEELLEMRGINYISTPRPGNRRGGGAAIAANIEHYSLAKLNISVPHNLEIVWGILKPRQVTGKIVKIIVCSFYCPPKSRKKNILIEHMTLTLQSLRLKFPGAGVIISGDRNDLKMEKLKSVDPALKQLVMKGTRGPKILTVVLSDLQKFYQEPEIVNPIDVDNPEKGGVPSDHNGVVVTPRSDCNNPPKRTKYVRTIRPITTSALNDIGQVLTQQTWQFMDPALTSTQLTELFQFYTEEILNLFCPKKQVLSRPDEKPFITEDMKLLKRRIMREYEKRHKSAKYYELKELFQQKYETEIIKYKEKIIDDVRNGDRFSTYSALRKLGVRPGESESGGFNLPTHVESNLTSFQSAELIADHFSAISMEYDPINVMKFPPAMRRALENPDVSVIPKLQDYQVYKRLCSAKKPNSQVPGDFPRKLIKEFSCELASPLTVIYNKILCTFEYPRQWVVEHQIPIPKVQNPSNEDDLRNIAKTTFSSKVFESFLADWLMPIVSPFIDPCQYGLRGASISHYLIKLLEFVHEHLDLRSPHAVLVAMVDLSKAFNRVSHQMVIEDLYDMHVPAWLLLILSSYLTGRSMILTYNGASSSPRNLPGSSPQGAFLGIFFFIVKYNAASLRPSIPRITMSVRCQNKLSKCKTRNCNTHQQDMHALYIDDLSEAEAINLKKQLINDPVQRPYPLNYHERTKQILIDSKLQENLIKIEQFTLENKMKINEKKSKVMIFNASKKFDFPPEMSFKSGEVLEYVEETKLLGIQINSMLRWNSNTSAIYKKAMARMWLLRRMKLLNLEQHVILDYYMKEIRPLAEQGVIVWNSGLTKCQVRDLEKIQKVAFTIILGKKYSNYEEVCKYFGLMKLSSRRYQLCANFAVKLFLSPRCDEFFTKLEPTRNNKNLVKENTSRTSRCHNAPHNYLARLVNQNAEKIIKKQYQ